MSRQRSAPGRSSWPLALCSRRRRDDRGLRGRRCCHRDRPTGPGSRRNDPGRGAAARFVPGRRGPCRNGGAPPEGQRGRPALSGRRRDQHGVSAWRTCPTGCAATGREQRASHWEYCSRGHSHDGNIHDEKENKGDERDEDKRISKKSRGSERRTGGQALPQARAATSVDDKLSQDCVDATYEKVISFFVPLQLGCLPVRHRDLVEAAS